MAGTGTKYLAFLITIHTLFFFAGASGLIDHRAGNSPDKSYVNTFRGENASRSAAVEDESGIVDGTFGPAAKSLNGLNVVSGILTGPYDVMSRTGLPKILIWLGQGLFGLFDLAVLISFLRGFPF